MPDPLEVEVSAPSVPPQPRFFLARHRRLIWGTTMTVFVLGFLITLFTAPTYRAVARVAPPAGSDAASERVRLMTPEVLQQASAMIPQANGRVRSHIGDAPDDGGGGIALMADGDNPHLVTDYANAWADAYAAAVASQGKGNVVVAHATVPDAPIAPKKARNLLFSAVFGTVLGFALAIVRDLLHRPA